MNALLTADSVIRILAASQIMLFMGVLLISANPRHVKAVGLVLMAAIVINFFAPLVERYYAVNNLELLYAVPSLIPVLTLLFVWVVFEEGCHIPKWIIALVLVDIAITAWRTTSGQAVLSIELIRQLLKVFAAAYAIYIVWRGRENDLIEMRQKIRIVFIGALVITVFGVSITETFKIYGIEFQGAILGSLWMLGITFLGNLGFIKLNPKLRLVGDPKELVTPKSVNDPAIDQLLMSMKEQRLYADHDLRVASLAEQIGIPEYQLRKKINQILGYRNFNQFVNRYRIEEAGERLLVDPRSPVLSIALDVGFRSISSFNTAFQTQFGVSPTKYRSQALSNS